MEPQPQKNVDALTALPLAPEQMQLPEKAVVGADVVVHTEAAREKVLLPGELLTVSTTLAKHYFNENFDPRSFEFSVRSRLMQAGLGLLFIEKGTGGNMRFTLRNLSQSELLVPAEFALGRFFITAGHWVEGDALQRLAPQLSAERDAFSIESDSRTMRLPIKKFAVARGGKVDIQALPKDRNSLDALLHLHWSETLGAVAADTLIIGETAPITIPQGYVGKILVGTENGAIHGQSALIDSGFTGRVRTEIWHMNPSQKPQDSVLMQLYKA